MEKGKIFKEIRFKSNFRIDKGPDYGEVCSFGIVAALLLILCLLLSLLSDNSICVARKGGRWGDTKKTEKDE